MLASSLSSLHHFPSPPPSLPISLPLTDFSGCTALERKQKGGDSAICALADYPSYPSWTTHLRLDYPADCPSHPSWWLPVRGDMLAPVGRLWAGRPGKCQARGESVWQSCWLHRVVGLTAAVGCQWGELPGESKTADLIILDLEETVVLPLLRRGRTYHVPVSKQGTVLTHCRDVSISFT